MTQERDHRELSDDELALVIGGTDGPGNPTDTNGAR